MMDVGSDQPDSAQQRDAIQYMMRRLDRFAQGLGLDEVATRQIVEKIAADMPKRSDEERLETARKVLLAAASA